MLWMYSQDKIEKQVINYMLFLSQVIDLFSKLRGFEYLLVNVNC